MFEHSIIEADYALRTGVGCLHKRKNPPAKFDHFMNFVLVSLLRHGRGDNYLIFSIICGYYPYEGSL